MAIPSVQILLNGQILDTILLDKPMLRIGRMKENDVVINNLAVSRFHAKLYVQKNQVVLEDQGSENGCYVNGKKIQRTEIKPQDEIIIGKHQLVLSAGDGAYDPRTEHYYFMDPNDTSGPAVAGKTKATSDAWDANSTYTVDQSTLQRAAQTATTPQETTQVTSEILRVHPTGAETFELVLSPEQKTFSIGRSYNSDLVLDQPQVSRRHSLLQRRANGLEIQDLDTGNGTFLNGAKIAQQAIKPGDTIGIGNYKIEFLKAVVAQPIKPAPAAPEKKSETTTQVTEVKVEEVRKVAEVSDGTPEATSAEASAKAEEISLNSVEQMIVDHQVPLTQMIEDEEEASIDIEEVAAPSGVPLGDDELNDNIEKAIRNLATDASAFTGDAVTSPQLTLTIDHLPQPLWDALSALLGGNTSQEGDKVCHFEIPVKLVLTPARDKKS